MPHPNLQARRQMFRFAAMSNFIPQPLKESHPPFEPLETPPQNVPSLPEPQDPSKICSKADILPSPLKQRLPKAPGEGKIKVHLRIRKKSSPSPHQFPSHNSLPGPRLKSTEKPAQKVPKRLTITVKGPTDNRYVSSAHPSSPLKKLERRDPPIKVTLKLPTRPSRATSGVASDGSILAKNNSQEDADQIHSAQVSSVAIGGRDPVLPAQEAKTGNGALSHGEKLSPGVGSTYISNDPSPKVGDDDVSSQAKNCLFCSKSSPTAALIPCAECGRAMHTHCLDPPMSFVPSFPWRCPTCLVKKKASCESKSIGTQTNDRRSVYLDDEERDWLPPKLRNKPKLASLLPPNPRHRSLPDPPASISFTYRNTYGTVRLRSGAVVPLRYKVDEHPLLCSDDEDHEECDVPVYSNADAFGLPPTMRECECCEAPHPGTFGSGRFCSSKCARVSGGMSRRRSHDIEPSLSLPSNRGRGRGRGRGKGRGRGRGRGKGRGRSRVSSPDLQDGNSVNLHESGDDAEEVGCYTTTNTLQRSRYGRIVRNKAAMRAEADRQTMGSPRQALLNRPQLLSSPGMIKKGIRVPSNEKAAWPYNGIRHTVLGEDTRGNGSFELISSTESKRSQETTKGNGMGDNDLPHIQMVEMTSESSVSGGMGQPAAMKNISTKRDAESLEKTVEDGVVEDINNKLESSDMGEVKRNHDFRSKKRKTLENSKEFTETNLEDAKALDKSGREQCTGAEGKKNGKRTARGVTKKARSLLPKPGKGYKFCHACEELIANRRFYCTNCGTENPSARRAPKMVAKDDGKTKTKAKVEVGNGNANGNDTYGLKVKAGVANSYSNGVECEAGSQNGEVKTESKTAKEMVVVDGVTKEKDMSMLNGEVGKTVNGSGNSEDVGWKRGLCLKDKDLEVMREHAYESVEELLKSPPRQPQSEEDLEIFGSDDERANKEVYELYLRVRNAYYSRIS